MSTPVPIPAIKGQIVCRAPDWTDVAKFFILNYGLHALTTVSKPGSGIITTIIDVVAAIVLPYSGIVRAIIVMNNFARGKKDQLKVAQKAGALCMVLTGELRDISLLRDQPTFACAIGR